MSSKKRGKKQRLPESVRPTRTSASSRTPRVEAVAGKRPPHEASPHRPPAPSPAGAPPGPATATKASAPVEPARPDERRVRPVLTAVSFTEEDPAAWAWLNTWPFLDDTDEGTEPEPPAEPGTVDPDMDSDPNPDPDSDPDPDPVVVGPSVAGVLAIAPAPTEESSSGSARRSRRVAAVAALVAAAVVVVGAWAWLTTGRGNEDRVRPTHSDANAAPVELPPATSFVRSRVLPSGDLEVTHWIHTRSAVDSLTVWAPQTLGVVAGSLSVSHFILVTGGTPYPAASMHNGHPQTFRFPAASVVYVRYRLSGAVRPSGPDGRALARITSLAVTTHSPMDHTTQSVVGAHVLALACSAPTATALPQPCGVEKDGSWHVALGRREAHERVMAQLDLSADGTEPVRSTR